MRRNIKGLIMRNIKGLIMRNIKGLMRRNIKGLMMSWVPIEQNKPGHKYGLNRSITFLTRSLRTSIATFSFSSFSCIYTSTSIFFVDPHPHGSHHLHPHTPSSHLQPDMSIVTSPPSHHPHMTIPHVHLHISTLTPSSHDHPHISILHFSYDLAFTVGSKDSHKASDYFQGYNGHRYLKPSCLSSTHTHEHQHTSAFDFIQSSINAKIKTVAHFGNQSPAPFYFTRSLQLYDEVVF